MSINSRRSLILSLRGKVPFLICDPHFNMSPQDSLEAQTKGGDNSLSESRRS